MNTFLFCVWLIPAAAWLGGVAVMLYAAFGPIPLIDDEDDLPSLAPALEPEVREAIKRSRERAQP